MSIQFHCPFCMAPIEVDGSAAGKIGKCPKCAARVTVPGRPRASTPQPVTANEETPPLADSPANDSPVSSSELPVFPELISPGTDYQLGTLPDPSRKTAGSIVARKVRRKTRRGGRWFIPVFFCCLFAGLLGALALRQMEWAPLNGEVTATTFRYFDDDPVMLHCTHVPFSDRQLQGVLAELERNPVPLSGNMSQAQIRGEADHLLLSVKPGQKTVWYRVDLTGHRGVGQFLTKSFSTLEATRRAAVESACSKFLEVALKVQNGEASYMAYSEFRDSLVVPASVQGLGFHLQAKVGSQLYPCIREPREAELYFLLPPGISTFQITGRQLTDGTTPFPGEFTVRVQVEKDDPKNRSLDASPTERTPADSTEINPTPEPENMAPQSEEATTPSLNLGQ